MTSPPPITVIGIGNPYRHDDAAGLAVLGLLHERFGDHPSVRLVELDGEPVRLIQAWEGSDAVLIVDAVRSLHPAGTVHRLTPQGAAGAASDGVSLGGGHLLGLGEAMDLARTLSKLPPLLEVIGIEGADFELGEGMTPAVTEACAVVAHQLMERIDTLLIDPLTTPQG